MALLPNLRLNPYVESYVGNANQEFEGLLKQKITDYDIAKAQDDVLGLQTDTLLDGVGPFEKDRQYALKLQDLYRNRINDRVGQGNYEDMLSATTRDAREFVKRIAPLQENYKRYSNYITAIDKEVQDGYIDRETADAVKRYSVSSYGGLDPNNVGSTLFNGVQPGRKFNATEFIDKIGNDWEASKGAVEYETADGRVVKKEWDQLTPQELLSGFQYALKGNREFQSYMQTQGEIGLGAKASQELNDAVAYGINKYQRDNRRQELSYMPEWAKEDQEKRSAFEAFFTSPTTGVVNPGENPWSNIVTDQSGVLSSDSQKLLIKRGDTFYKWVDKDGNIVPKDIIKREQGKISEYDIKGLNAFRDKYQMVEAKPEDIVKLDEELNTDFEQFINNTIRINTDPKTYTAPDLSTPRARKRVKEIAERAFENSRTLYGNTKYNLFNTNDKIRENGIDNYIANNPSGFKLYIKSTDPKLAGIGQQDNEKGVDLNALLEEVYNLDDKNWQVVSRRGDGFETFNPYGNLPAANIKLELKNKEGETAIIELGAELPANVGQKLIPGNNVMKAVANGVPYKEIPLDQGAKFVVKSGVNLKTERYESTVELHDKDGNIVQTVTGDTFPDFYSQLLKAYYPKTINELTTGIKFK